MTSKIPNAPVFQSGLTDMMSGFLSDKAHFCACTRTAVTHKESGGVDMGLNDTPVSERIQIGFFGCTNAGKSSLINAITGQDVSVVSDKKGTTTDPVLKTMELGDLGPVAIIDTPGLDDDTDIGELRVKRSNEIFNRTDIAVIVTDVQDTTEKTAGFVNAFIKKCEDEEKPFVVAANKSENISENNHGSPANAISVSAVEKTGLNELKEAIIVAGKDVKKKKEERLMVSDLIESGDTVVLVIPIDESAPQGRLILPQQQVIRDVLEAGGNAVCIKDTELKEYFEKRPEWNEPGMHDVTIPALVVTDSQVFKEVNDIVPEHIPLTSFSIIMARYKGTLAPQASGAKVIDTLEDGDTVLVAEGCTHHRHCEDIGTVKLPRLLMKYTGKKINIETSSGHGYPENLSKYKLILHCGGCMLNEKEMQSRMEYAGEKKVPITNYGVAIAYMNGILKRSIEPLPEFAIE